MYNFINDDQILLLLPRGYVAVSCGLAATKGTQIALLQYCNDVGCTACHSRVGFGGLNACENGVAAMERDVRQGIPLAPRRC